MLACDIEATIELPIPIASVFKCDRGSVRYRGAWGGRGSGKSFSFALMAAIYGYAEPLRILCTREYLNSIKESFHAELSSAINSVSWLSAHYSIGESYISGANGTEFIFKGLRNNISAIKSMAKIDICIVEEAEDIPEASWQNLTPTIRAPKSEIWVIWNPLKELSPVDVRFRKNADQDMIISEVQYTHNKWFPDVLEKERQRDQRNLDQSVYAHIWEGEYLRITDAQVLNGKVSVNEFTPVEYWNGPYYGCDWGFSVDPTTLAKSWIHADSLYIEYEAYEVGTELDHLPNLFMQVPDSKKHVIYADSARPETISYMRRQGFNIVAAKKAKGSVEDGIAHLRGFEKIVIHPRCIHTIKESRLWSYKRDRLSGDVLPVLLPGNDHTWDAIRYSQEKVMKGKSNKVGITTPQQPSLGSW